MGLEVADKAFVGDAAGFLEYVHTLSDIDVGISNHVSDGQERVPNNHLVRDVFEVDLHVLEVGHWVVKVVFDDVYLQLAGPFSGVWDDGVKVDPEVEEAD